MSDIWSWDPPLVGAFSRYGWSHPGPVWFGVLAVFAGIGGDSGMVIGSILMSGAILAGTVVLVWRRLGTWAASVAVGASGLTVAGVGAFGGGSVEPASGLGVVRVVSCRTSALRV